MTNAIVIILFVWSALRCFNLCRTRWDQHWFYRFLVIPHAVFVVVFVANRFDYPGITQILEDLVGCAVVVTVFRLSGWMSIPQKTNQSTEN
jgi:hypothetical protein